MGMRIVAELVVGFILLTVGVFFTFKTKLTYQKESTSDLFAVVGIILMIIGVVLIFSPLLR